MIGLPLDIIETSTEAKTRMPTNGAETTHWVDQHFRICPTTGALTPRGSAAAETIANRKQMRRPNTCPYCLYGIPTPIGTREARPKLYGLELDRPTLALHPFL